VCWQHLQCKAWRRMTGHIGVENRGTGVSRGYICMSSWFLCCCRCIFEALGIAILMGQCSVTTSERCAMLVLHLQLPLLPSTVPPNKLKFGS
jgi:hypothetical protein